MLEFSMSFHLEKDRVYVRKTKAETVGASMWPSGKPPLLHMASFYPCPNEHN